MVTKSLNPALSNSDWRAKRKELKKSVLLLHAELQDLDEWDEDLIEGRSSELFQLAKKIWLRPS